MGSVVGDDCRLCLSVVVACSCLLRVGRLSSADCRLSGAAVVDGCCWYLVFGCCLLVPVGGWLLVPGCRVLVVDCLTQFLRCGSSSLNKMRMAGKI